MLINLHVKNLALIKEADVEFGPGLNILTGETGAGKSILLGSMQLILGGRPSRDMIRAQEESALVELLFQTEDEESERMLKEAGIKTEDGQVLLSRRITEGRSICRINGETGTVGQMKAAAACLLDIHGQHEHQSLLQRGKQLDILDAYGGAEVLTLRQSMKEAYVSCAAARKTLSALDIDEEQRRRETAFLEFEISEIESAALKEGEDEELEKKYRKLANSRKITDAVGQVREMTAGDGGAGDLCGTAAHELSRVADYDEEISQLQEILEQAQALLEDFNRELYSYQDSMTFNEEEFYETEQRLDLINERKARYGSTIPEILAYQEAQQKKLDALYDHDRLLAQAKKELEKAVSRMEKEGEKLSELRRKYAVRLEKEITEGLRELNFADVRFRIRFDRKDFSENGMDEIEYEIATNPGEELKPLGRIVSGGELSRIMLAIKTILADRDQIDTLIFDEIDTGISGRTAQMVARKMAQIGRCRQVICITHLPQIAAMADRHFEIEKHTDPQGRTRTEIHPLDEEASVRELARLLGGESITSAALANAREMKRTSDVEKGVNDTDLV